MSFGHWPAPNILALYRLDNVNDASGNGHTLVNKGTVTFGLGKFGKCALLGSSNTSKYLSHGDSLGKDLSGAACVSIWFMILTLPSSGAAQTIFTWDSTTGTTRYIQLMYSNDGGTYQLWLDASGTVITYVVTLSADGYLTTVGLVELVETLGYVIPSMMREPVTDGRVGNELVSNLRVIPVDAIFV